MPQGRVTTVPDDGLTTRQRVDLQTGSGMCASCHNMINPLGFALEEFDAVGRFRTTEGDRPVHAASDYITAEGQTIHLAGATDLARHAAASAPAHRAFIEQLFHQIVKQPVEAYGPDAMDRLAAAFRASEFNIQKLIVEIATLAALHQPAPEDSAPLTVNPEPLTTRHSSLTSLP